MPRISRRTFYHGAPEGVIPDVQPLTNSIRRRFQTCPKAFDYMAVQLAQPRTTGQGALRGSAVHLFLDHWLKTQKPDESLKHAVNYIDSHIKENERFYHPEELEKIDKARSLVIGICRALPENYRDFGGTLVAHELHLRYPVPTAGGDFSVYAGTIDGIIETPKGYWILDYKTKATTNPDTAEWLRIDTQTVGYNWLLRKYLAERWVGKKKAKQKPVLGVLYNIIGISRIKHKKAQTLEEYHDELEQIYLDNGDKYFVQIPARHRDENVADWEEDLIDDVKAIQARIKTKKFPRCTSQCLQQGWSCDYLRLCLDGWNRVNENFYNIHAPNYWDPKSSLEGELLDV